jgi:alkylation response protein AidB-like acyl-CoA dehydrogenase
MGLNEAETFEWMRQRIADLERKLAAAREALQAAMHNDEGWLTQAHAALTEAGEGEK